MKGSGGGYGFNAVTDIGKAIEDAATRIDSEEVRRRLKELEDYIERVEVVYR